ncbi:MAG: polysaccharide biosynthesis protein [Deltaproteobacteria bacterium]|nr:polysaccharide biosynthesis protein [Deltaproteobacteria bacterium]
MTPVINYYNNTILKHRRALIIIVQTLLIPFSYFTAFLLRFDFYIDEYILSNYLKTLPLLIIARLIFFYYVDLFNGWWRYVSIEDIIKIANAIIFSSLLFIASVVFIFGMDSFPRSVFITDAIVLFMCLCGIRVSTRIVKEKIDAKKQKGSAKNVLIVGAGNTGVTVLNELRGSADVHLNPIGFIDDDPAKKSFRIKNLQILGTITNMPALINQHSIDEVLIAMPSATQQTLNNVYTICDNANITYKTLPAMARIISGKTFVSQMRDVEPAELLGRPAVTFDDEKNRLQKEIFNRCVLVTGAGGSIGSELCRQIASFKPNCLIMYERTESNLYFIDLEIRKKFPQLRVVSIIGDILNVDKFENILETYAPYIIYHAAAYKHVPLMERDPFEAVRNNFFGSKAISELCVKHAVEKLVFISTDKAVNPSSVMGTTKRMTEKQNQTYGTTPTRFISVRFGNVIGSSGSVIPLFKKQISEGGPVTVTHPETTRFLMTIPEAVHLVLLAGSMGKGSEIFLLDMGEPANIAERAKSLIELSGLTPGKDITIEYIGLREGEKLHEELYWEGADIMPTAHKKIRKLSNTRFNYLSYKLLGSKLEKNLPKSLGNEELIFDLVKAMVPESTIAYLAHRKKTSG